MSRAGFKARVKILKPGTKQPTEYHLTDGLIWRRVAGKDFKERHFFPPQKRPPQKVQTSVDLFNNVKSFKIFKLVLFIQGKLE